MAHVPSDAVRVVHGRADFQIGPALGAGTDVDPEDALEKSGSAVVLDLFLVNGFWVKAFARLRIENDQIAPLAM